MPSPKFRTCPNCAAPILIEPDDSFNIQWNDAKKEFAVFLRVGFCPQCGPGGKKGELIKYLPVDIANKSNCACGRTLNLGDFKVTQTEDGFTLNAQYYCPSCGQKNFIEKVKTALVDFWKNTRKIEVGAEGVKYEKSSK